MSNFFYIKKATQSCVNWYENLDKFKYDLLNDTNGGCYDMLLTVPWL